MKWSPNSYCADLADHLRSLPHPGGIIVSERHAFVYMKPPRTGGTTILRGTLEPMGCEPFQCKDHPRRFARWLQAVSDHNLRRYRFFTFVRNPWDRAVSIASYFRLDFRRFALEYDRLTATNKVLRQHALPLHSYTHCDDECYIDFVGRFETLQADFDKLMELLELKPKPLPHLSRSNHRDYREYYDAETKAAIDRIYGKDAELFGYDFDG